MTFRLSKDFVRGMKFTNKRNIKQVIISSRKNTVEESWNKTGKYLYDAMKKYDKDAIRR